MAADDLLLKWVTPDETAAEFLARQFLEAVSTGLPFLDKHVKLRPGHLLEIIGPAGTAKTEILTEIAANIMTKAAATAEAAGGHTQEQEHVVVIDCDGKFDTLRLLQLVTGRLPPSAVATQSLQQLGTALERFHLFRCFSSTELLLALNSLPGYLAQLQGRCRLLLVDNIAAYVWHDRAAAAAASSSSSHFASSAAAPPYTPGFQGPPAAAAAAAGLSAQRVQAAAAALLTELSQAWRLPVVVSKQAGVSLEERHDGPVRLVQRELMTLPWQKAVTHRLLLAPVMLAGQALQQLAVKGPAPTELMMQWQAQGNTAPIERCAVTANATISC